MEKTRTCEIYMDEFGILHVKMLGGVIMDKEDAADNFLVARTLTKNKKVLKLIDSRSIYGINKGGRDFIEKQSKSRPDIAKAILVSTLLQKYLMIFFNSLETPLYPVKIFTSKKKAIDWLKSFL